MRSSLLLVLAFGLIYAGYSFYSDKAGVPQINTSESALHDEPSTASAPPLNSSPSIAYEKPSSPPLKIADLSAKQKASADKAIEYFKNRLQFLEKCFQRRCKLPNSDSRSYEHAVYMEVENTLETLKDWQKRHHLQDRRISRLVLSFLAFEKSEIKVTALEILATQPKDGRVVPHILGNVIDQAYPEPIPLAIRELARYKNSKHQQKIDVAVITALTHGSIFSAIEIAQNVQPLITPQNRIQFEDAMTDLSKQPLSRGIHAALRESLHH